MKESKDKKKKKKKERNGIEGQWEEGGGGGGGVGGGGGGGLNISLELKKQRIAWRSRGIERIQAKRGEWEAQGDYKGNEDRDGEFGVEWAKGWCWGQAIVSSEKDTASRSGAVVLGLCRGLEAAAARGKAEEPTTADANRRVCAQAEAAW